LSLVIETSTVIAVIGLCLSAAAFLINTTKASKGEAVKLENRLTKLEADQFTDQDRKCLYDIHSRFSILWRVFENDLPRFLKQEKTPQLDAILDRVEKVGLRGLTDSEYVLLEQYITSEYEKTLLDETVQDRGFRLAIYRAVAKFSRNHDAFNSCGKAKSSEKSSLVFC
jgi:hypothetical protein